MIPNEFQPSNLEHFKTDVVSLICKILNNHPEQWSWYGSERYFIQHLNSDLKVSVKRFYIYTPRDLKFKFFQRRRLRRAFRRWEKDHGDALENASQQATCQYIINLLQ